MVGGWQCGWLDRLAGCVDGLFSGLAYALGWMNWMNG